MLDISPQTQHDHEDLHNMAQEGTQKDLHSQVNPDLAAKYAPGGKSLMDESDNLDFIDDRQDASKMLFTFTAIVTVLVMGFWVYLYFAKVSKESQLTTLNTQNDELQQQFQQPEILSIDKLATRLSGGLKALNQLINSQTQYSKLFDELDKIIPTSSVVQSLSIDAQNTISLTANSQTLDDSAKLVKAFQVNKNFTNLVLGSDTESQEADRKIYSVSLTVTYKPIVTLSEDSSTTIEETTITGGAQ